MADVTVEEQSLAKPDDVDSVKMEAWYMDDADDDQRKPHRLVPNEPCDARELASLGVLYWKLDEGIYESDPKLEAIKKCRGYSFSDMIEVSPETLPGYEEKIKCFYEEHIHSDEEIRYVLRGSGYFDIRGKDERWIRMWTKAGDLIILPAGSYHRFTLDESNYVKALRLFVGEPVWTPINRGVEADQATNGIAYLVDQVLLPVPDESDVPAGDRRLQELLDQIDSSDDAVVDLDELVAASASAGIESSSEQIQRFQEAVPGGANIDEFIRTTPLFRQFLSQFFGLFFKIMKNTFNISQMAPTGHRITYERPRALPITLRASSRRLTRKAAIPGGNADTEESPLSTSTVVFLGKLTVGAFAGAAAVKYGSLLTDLAFTPSPLVALAIVFSPPVGFAAWMLTQDKET